MALAAARPLSVLGFGRFEFDRVFHLYSSWFGIHLVVCAVRGAAAGASSVFAFMRCERYDATATAVRVRSAPALRAM